MDAGALEDEILQLTERQPLDARAMLEKQRLYTRVGQFLFNRGGLTVTSHWWCTYPTLMVFMMRLLELYPSTESVCAFYDRMAQQLGVCYKCVDLYHASLPSVRVELEFEFTSSSVKSFFIKVAQLDADRLQRVFQSSQQGNAGTSATKSVVSVTTSTALYEVLSQRRLFSDFRIIRVLSKWFSSAAVDIKDMPNLHLLRECPGLYHLLVSPDSGVRAWATTAIWHLGKIDLSGEEAQAQPFFKVLDEWMYILESASFNVPVLSLDLQATAELPMFLDATNCVKTPTNQTLWAALDTVMQQMDEDSLEAILESFDNLPDLVFNYLNDADPSSTNQQITLVISKCYAVLLRCLGHRFWNHTVHSPKVVVNMVMQHCQQPAWRGFVIKHLVELLPPLFASMRPPHITSSESNRTKMNAYFQTRDKLLQFLVNEKERPAHFQSETMLKVACSKAVSTIVCDCYEPRLLSSGKDEDSVQQQSRDDGALPDSALIDYSISENAFWWPCGSDAKFGATTTLEELWTNHLFDIIIDPQNVMALVDHVAITCSTLLRKHFQLARHVIYTCMIEGDARDNQAKTKIEDLTQSKPIIPLILTKLCAWETITTIPVTVHGALFECLGVVAELLNAIAHRANLNENLVALSPILEKYEACIFSYLQRISEEVLVKGLINPLRFPVVAQHLTLCLLSPNNNVDQSVKRLLGNVAASRDTPTKIPSFLEAYLVFVHRNTEAFLRGMLTLLQSMRLYDFSLVVCLPTLKKIIFMWSKAFELLGNDLKEILSVGRNGSASSNATQPGHGSGAVNLQKLPNLINDFLIALLSCLYQQTTRLDSAIDETVLVRCLDFGVAFWTFWTIRLNSPDASSKRSAGLIPSLVECISRGSPAEKARGAELLMIVLETLLHANTPLDNHTLRMIDNIKPIASSIQSKKSTDFARVTKKFRQLDKSARFFAKRPVVQAGRTSALELSARPPKMPPTDSFFVERENGITRPMSGKAAARAQAKMTIDLTGVSAVESQAAARKQHSFYSEEEYHAPKSKEPSPSTHEMKSKSHFNMVQVIKDIAHSHNSHHQVNKIQPPADIPQPKQISEKEQEIEEEDPAMNFAALFHRIKTTQKPIPVCSLLPFYRHLLQLCMPILLTHEFENESSDRTLPSPDLTFKKSSAYVNAFLPLLLEECNNEIQEELRNHYTGHSGGHLLRYESEKSREGMRCLSFSIAQKDENAKTSHPRGRGNHGGRGFNQKIFRNGDVVILRIAAGAARQQSGFMGKREFLGVIMVTEVEKGKRRTETSKRNNGAIDEDESVKVLFLNDGELESVTGDVSGFSMESLTADALVDSEWKAHCLCNLVTSAREYIALRSVDMLPEHLRTTILTPNMYKSTQSELLLMTTVLDELRIGKSSENDVKIVKLLKRLDKTEVTLMDLRTTSIGKAIHKLRKHENSEIKSLALKLKGKWTALMDQTDALERPPRFLPPELWDAIKAQYNQSQLQSIHSVLNNYSVGVSLLQGPPGTGKTKTIMGLLSGFLSLRPPATSLMPPTSVKSTMLASSSVNASSDSVSRTMETSKPNVSTVQQSRSTTIGSEATTPRSTFVLSGVVSGMGSILRRSDAELAKPKMTTVQSLKNASSVRSRLEQKLSSRTPQQSAAQKLVVRHRVISSSSSARSVVKACNVLLCAPSNGAVDELVLRIVTDGLMDSSGKITKVRAPSIHHEAITEEWLSIVRLGNPGEDAPESVKTVCLPHIIKQELEMHPKTMMLRTLQETQQTLRNSIRNFHEAKKKTTEKKGATDRKALAKMHAQLTECSGKVRRLRDEVFALQSKMTEAILSKASIIACTLSKAGSGAFNGLKRGFDALIVDEAAQAIELSTLVPIRERVARVVLVGDPKQLPATVKSVVAANARYDRSLFERIAESGVAPSMLRVQYRMHPFLREFPSKRFYGGMLTDGPSIMERVERVCSGVYKFACFQPFLLYDIVNSNEEDMNGSKYNRGEAEFCVDLCQSMLKMCADVTRNKWTVGFVSPYREQVQVLRREVGKAHIPASVSIEVNTVDGFQGREKDVIIFSCVRSSRRGGIGFLKDIRRLNVAITRAKFCLFVVGNVDTLIRDDTWAALVQSAQERKLIVRTRSSKFEEVARRLESDESKSLMEHYKEMHAKVRRKSTGSGSVSEQKQIKAERKEDIAQSNNEDRREVSLNGSDELKSSKSSTNATTGNHNTIDTLSNHQDESEKNSHSASTSADSQRKRPANDELTRGNDKIMRGAASSEFSVIPSKATMMDDNSRANGSSLTGFSGYDIASGKNIDRQSRRDRSSSCSQQSRRDEGGERSFEHRGSSRDRGANFVSGQPRRDSRGQPTGERTSELYPSTSNVRHDRFHGHQRNYASKRNEGHHPPASSVPSLNPPQSISAKEFCMVNEPPPPVKQKRPANSSTNGYIRDRVVEKLVSVERKSGLSTSTSKYHAATQPRRQQPGSLSSARNDSQRPRNPKTVNRPPTPSRNSGGVLGSILGSAAQLANATSRVNDKAGHGSSEFR